MKVHLGISLLFACHHLCHAAAFPEPETRRPNILLLVADDLGWNDVGYHGGGIRTPNIDSLGKAGAVLNQFYVMPSCTPTRACLLTGRYPMRYGLHVSVIKNTNRYGLSLRERLLPQALKEAGYQTAIVGKWHLGHHEPEYLPSKRGFDHHYGCYTGMIDYVTHTSNAELKWDARTVEPDQITKPSDDLRGHDWNRNGEELREKGFVTDLIRDEAIRLIHDRDPAKPLFLYVPFTAPHTPLQAKSSDLKAYDGEILDVPDAFGPDGQENAQLQNRRRHYAALVSGMDDAIGDILDVIEKQGMSDNTIVVFMSDNGGSYQGGNNDPLRAQKMFVYEGGVRVPAIISFPGKIRSGTMVDTPLHAVDVYPTLVKLAGASLEQPLPLDGTDIWPVLTEGRFIPDREILIHARKGRSSAIRVGDWKLVRNGRLGPIKTIGDKEDVYELFNLRDDPCERVNLSSKNPRKLQELRQRLDAYTEAAVTPLYQPASMNDEPAPSAWLPYWWKND